ncbi:hypothetical protein FHS15_000104 [Paenibacillus castaneae]|nr:hypothetical protein [Paenibacillus castaneae]
MEFLLLLEKSYISYSDLMCSNQANSEPLLSEKYNALWRIALFMYEDFVKQLSAQHQ